MLHFFVYNSIIFTEIISGGIMPKFKIKNNEINADIVNDIYEFPKYTTQIINLANQNAQGTRARVVGQMSDLIQEFSGSDISEWEKWYKTKHPESIDNATEKIYQMILNLQTAILQIDKELVKNWVSDLVINKTYTGLRFQKSIIKRVADNRNEDWRLATPDEESKGIDGFIGSNPVSIKASTYKTKKMLNEKIEVEIIYYDKKKDGINIEY